MKKHFSVWIICVLFLPLMACSPQEKKSLALSKPICLSTQSECQIQTSFGTLSVLFDRERITPEVEFSIFVGNKQLNTPIIVTGYMEGKSMYMGKIPLFFSQQPTQGMYMTNTLLGSCTDKKMEWLLHLNIKPLDADKNIKPEVFTVTFASIRE